MVWAITYHGKANHGEANISEIKGHFVDNVVEECVVCEDQAQQGCGEVQGRVI